MPRDPPANMELGFPSPAMFTQEISSFFGLQDARKAMESLEIRMRSNESESC